MSLVGTKAIDQFTIGSEQATFTTVTLKVGENVAAFTPLMMEVSTGKVIAFDKAKIGTDITAFISPEALDATAADLKVAVIAGGRFNAEMVAWTTSPTDAQKASVFAGTPVLLDTLYKG